MEKCDSEVADCLGRAWYGETDLARSASAWQILSRACLTSSIDRVEARPNGRFRLGTSVSWSTSVLSRWTGLRFGAWSQESRIWIPGGTRPLLEEGECLEQVVSGSVASHPSKL